MAKFWREPLDPRVHRDMMVSTLGGNPVHAPADRLIPAWVYFVRVQSFTFQFVSLDQLREALRYCEQSPRPSTMRSGITLEHYWQRWFERLPPRLLRGRHREVVVSGLRRALEHFEDL